MITGGSSRDELSEQPVAYRSSSEVGFEVLVQLLKTR